MKIYLLRHGETTGDVEGRYGGDYDDPLTEKGRKQSEELAEKLRGKGIEIIYHSPKTRAAETAQIIGKKLGLRLQAIEDLRERNNYGVLTGLTRNEAKQEFPEEVKKLLTGKLEHDIKDSEDYKSFKERVMKAFKKITSNKYSTTAIVTHGGPIRCVYREVLKLGELDKLKDCAIFEVGKVNGKYKLLSTDN